MANEEIEHRLAEELNRQLGALDQAVQEHSTGDGKPPPWMIAQADQMRATTAALADAFILKANEHRALGKECCQDGGPCVGIEMMLAVSTTLRVTPQVVVPALVDLLGRAAIAEARVVELEAELATAKGDR